MPAKQGNVALLLAYTLGAVLTGKAIDELVELINNKRTNEPTLKEAIVAGDKKDQIRAAMRTMQLASYGGMVGDLLKSGLDLTSGHLPRGFTFPLIDQVTENIIPAIGDYVTAIDSGEDAVNTTLGFAQQLAVNYLQAARIAHSHINQEDSARKDKFRDKRTFEELRDYKDPDSIGSRHRSNKLLNPEQREFKEESDITKAAGMVPGLIGDALEKSPPNTLYGYSKFKDKMESLKRNSYQTFPNPETEPVKTIEYLEYLTETQGRDEAGRRLQDYMYQKAVNKAKSSMIPKI